MHTCAAYCSVHTDSTKALLNIARNHHEIEQFSTLVHVGPIAKQTFSGQQKR